MVNKNHAILGLISLVVLASGCTNTGGETDVSRTPNTGVSIQSFSAFPSEVSSSGGTEVTLRVQNTGGAIARNVDATIYNLAWGSGASAGSQSWGYSNEDSTTGGGSPQDPALNFTGALRPPEPDTGIPSTSKTKTLTLNAPTGDQQIESSYNLMMDLYYDYNTTAQTQITLMEESQYMEEQPTRSRPEVENTAGPIKVKIRTETPLVTRGNNQRQVCFVVNNVGTGTPYLNGDENEVDLTVNAPTTTGTLFDDSVTISEQTGQGGECASLASNVGSASQQATIPIEATADYQYKKSTETSLTLASD